jgi:flagellar hook-length control protein FliK
MGLNLDTTFSSDLLASSSTSPVRQSTGEQADTPFQLPDYAEQDEPEVTTNRHSEPKVPSPDADALTPQEEEGYATDVTAEQLVSGDTAATETADDGGIAPTTTNSLSALPDSMIWMQPQDFQALLRADQATLDTMAETELPQDPALPELAVETDAESVVADELHSHTLPAVTTTPQDSSSALLNASMQASALPLWMGNAASFEAVRSSAAATVTDAASSLSPLTTAEPADTNTRFLSRDSVLATATTAASPSLASSTLASPALQAPTVSDSDKAAPSLAARLGSSALPSTADAAALRQSARATPLSASALLDSTSTMLLTGGGPNAATLAPAAVQNQLVVDSSHSGWGQQLVNSLGERVHLQASQQLQQATIRLDPPELGRLEVIVRQDHDRLSVQISTSNSALRDALQETREQLRQILIPEYGAGVEVEINYSGDSRQQTQTEALLEEEIVSNGITFATGQEVAETAGAVVNSGLLDTLV